MAAGASSISIFSRPYLETSFVCELLDRKFVTTPLFNSVGGSTTYSFIGGSGCGPSFRLGYNFLNLFNTEFGLYLKGEAKWQRYNNFQTDEFKEKTHGTDTSAPAGMNASTGLPSLGIGAEWTVRFLQWLSAGFFIEGFFEFPFVLPLSYTYIDRDERGNLGPEFKPKTPFQPMEEQQAKLRLGWQVRTIVGPIDVVTHLGIELVPFPGKIKIGGTSQTGVLRSDPDNAFLSHLSPNAGIGIRFTNPLLNKTSRHSTPTLSKQDLKEEVLQLNADFKEIIEKVPVDKYYPDKIKSMMGFPITWPKIAQALWVLFPLQVDRELLRKLVKAKILRDEELSVDQFKDSDGEKHLRMLQNFITRYKEKVDHFKPETPDNTLIAHINNQFEKVRQCIKTREPDATMEGSASIPPSASYTASLGSSSVRDILIAIRESKSPPIQRGHSSIIDRLFLTPPALPAPMSMDALEESEDQDKEQKEMKRRAKEEALNSYQLPLLGVGYPFEQSELDLLVEILEQYLKNCSD